MHNVSLQKIPVDNLLHILSSLKDSGAVYFDIIISPGTIQDGFGIVVREEYYLNEEKPLSEEDINTLTDE